MAFRRPAESSHHFAPKPQESAPPASTNAQTNGANTQAIQSLQQQLDEALATNHKLLALHHLEMDFENISSPEKSAQILAQALLPLVPCQLVCIFEYSPLEQRFKRLASVGPAAGLVPTNFQPDQDIPIIRQALHSQKLVSSFDLHQPGFAMFLGGQLFPALLAAPMVRRGSPRGLILLAGTQEQTFHPQDAQVVEAAAAHLLTLWDSAYQNETLTHFIQNVLLMAIVQETGSLLEMIASIAQQTLEASFLVVAILHQHEWLMRSVGQAEQLLQSLQNEGLGFLEEALQSPYTFRLHDLKHDSRAALLHPDQPHLATLLACPIRINGTAAGIILAFGKNNPAGFSQTDVFLAELLASQSAVNLESCYLNQEMRTNLKTSQLLYDLSMNIAQSDTLEEAAQAIGNIAYRLLQARKCGLILFSTEGWTEAEVRFPKNDANITHPYNLIQQAMDSRQTIYLAEEVGFTKIAIPIQTTRRCYGALWLEMGEDSEETRHPTEEIRVLVNQAAVALERSILLEETRQQANEITRTYRSLDHSYDLLLVGLTRALDARDRETEGHSERVRTLAVNLGIEIGLSKVELKAMERGALLHDIGKIGISDSILLKTGPLDPSEWQTMHQHPQIGAHIVQGIPPLQDALEVIAFHQERWDGSGYPAGLRGKDIPLLARIFAVIDVYDALTSNRPYRTALSSSEAIAYLQSQTGIHFDPDVVQRFAQMMEANPNFATGADTPAPS